MASQLFVSGPTNVYINGGGTTALAFLGIAENEIEVSFSAKFKDVQADYAGGSDGVPADKLYLGQMAAIKMTLSRYQMGVLENAQARVQNPSGSLGTTGPFDTGTLMATQGQAFRLLLYPQFVVNNSALQVLNFLSTVCDSDIVLNYSTRNMVAQLLFTAFPTWTIDSSGSGFNGILYNNSTTGIPNPQIV